MLNLSLDLQKLVAKAFESQLPWYAKLPELQRQNEEAKAERQGQMADLLSFARRERFIISALNEATADESQVRTRPIGFSRD